VDINDWQTLANELKGKIIETTNEHIQISLKNKILKIYTKLTSSFPIVIISMNKNLSEVPEE